jgi:hypothetical protein
MIKLAGRIKLQVGLRAAVRQQGQMEKRAGHILRARDFSPACEIWFNNFYIQGLSETIKLRIKNVLMEDCR